MNLAVQSTPPSLFSCLFGGLFVVTCPASEEFARIAGRGLEPVFLVGSVPPGSLGVPCSSRLRSAGWIIEACGQEWVKI